MQYNLDRNEMNLGCLYREKGNLNLLWMGTKTADMRLHFKVENGLQITGKELEFVNDRLYLILQGE